MMRKSATPLIISIILAFVLAVFGDSIIFDKSIQSFEKNSQDNDIAEIQRYAQTYNPALFVPLSDIHSTNDLVNCGSDRVLLVGADEVKKYSLQSDPNRESEDKAMLHFTKNQQTGYIAVNHLLPGSYRQFMNTVDAIAGETGFDTLLIDLRKCQTGLVSEAIKIANQLINGEDVLLGTERYFNGQVNSIHSTGKVFFPLHHIKVFIGPETLNVGECLTMMLGASDDVTLIGHATGGNQYLYRYFSLSSGKFVKLAVGQFRLNDDDEPDYKMMPVTPDLEWDNKEIESMIEKI